MPIHVAARSRPLFGKVGLRFADASVGQLFLEFAWSFPMLLVLMLVGDEIRHEQ